MLPNYYACSGCDETFHFANRTASYLFDASSQLAGGRTPRARLFDIPVRSGWCKHCAALCLVEDIAPVRAFEDAYGAVKAGKVVEYPTPTENLSAPEAIAVTEAFLRWRMNRRSAPRALCCGRSDYQLLDVPQPLIKHAECDFGTVGPRYVFSSFCGSGPGVYSPANIPVHDGEGELIGLMTMWDRETDTWEVAPLAYPPRVED